VDVLASDRQIIGERELLGIFSRIVGDLLEDDSIALTMTTRRSDVPDWDSFSYINFFATVEMELNVRFGVADVESFDDVGAIVRRTQALLLAPE
jgi:acyl carrier protein